MIKRNVSIDKKKKDLEERILSAFVSNKKLGFIVSSIVPLDPPDFKITKHARRPGKEKEIGVELTRVFNPNLKKKEAFQDKVIEAARDKFKVSFTDDLVVLVYFRNVEFEYNQASLRMYSDFICNLVSSVVKQNQGFEYRVVTNNIELPAGIEKISISTEPGYENWQSFGAFLVPFIDEAWFAEIIRKKEEKIKTYPERFDEVWLVLIANFGHRSSGFRFSELRNEYKDSKFDKIFVYKYMADEVVKIK